MHELSLAGAIVDAAIRHADGRRVVAVQVRIGALRQVVPTSLSFLFDFVTRDTLCDHARLDQVVIPAALRCAGCETTWEPEMPMFRCPRCPQGHVSIVRGNEFEIESIEVEEVACTTSR